MLRSTPYKDKHGRAICDGHLVSLAGNMTADDTITGELPNGWTFDESDVFEVVWDEKQQGWTLSFDCEPDTDYNIKYMNHARSLLVNGSCEIVGTGWPEILLINDPQEAPNENESKLDFRERRA